MTYTGMTGQIELGTDRMSRAIAAVCRPAPAAPTRSKHRTATKEK
jgi:hypothetical protein